MENRSCSQRGRPDRGRVRVAAPRCRAGRHSAPPNPWDGGQFCLPRGAPGVAAWGAEARSSPAMTLAATATVGALMLSTWSQRQLQAKVPRVDKMRKFTMSTTSRLLTTCRQMAAVHFGAVCRWCRWMTSRTLTTCKQVASAWFVAWMTSRLLTTCKQVASVWFGEIGMCGRWRRSQLLTTRRHLMRAKAQVQTLTGTSSISKVLVHHVLTVTLPTAIGVAQTLQRLAFRSMRESSEI